MISISIALVLLTPLTLAVLDGPEDIKNEIYLADMCLPRLRTEGTPAYRQLRATAHSPFPCEQVSHLSTACFSNGTTEIDFLAEQQCLCGGNYFAALLGCKECYYAHGFFDADSPRDKALSEISRLSSAECSATPITMPYTNLRTSTAGPLSKDATIINDRFPNDTAISNYWTGATAPIAGQITGSATARLTKYTNTDEVRYTPTGTTEAGSGGGGGTSSTNPPTGESTSSTNPPSPSSTNGAAGVKAAGGLLAVVIGVMAAL